MLKEHPLECFETGMAESVMGMHRVVRGLAEDFKKVIDASKDRAQNPWLRLRLGCKLYAHIAFRSVKLTAWYQVVEAYDQAHAALSASDRSRIDEYDQAKVEELLRGRRTVYPTLPELFECQREDSALRKRAFQVKAPAAKKAKMDSETGAEGN